MKLLFFALLESILTPGTFNVGFPIQYLLAHKFIDSIFSGPVMETARSVFPIKKIPQVRLILTLDKRRKIYINRLHQH